MNELTDALIRRKLVVYDDENNEIFRIGKDSNGVLKGLYEYFVYIKLNNAVFSFSFINNELIGINSNLSSREKLEAFFQYLIDIGVTYININGYAFNGYSLSGLLVYMELNSIMYIFGSYITNDNNIGTINISPTVSNYLTSTCKARNIFTNETTTII